MKQLLVLILIVHSFLLFGQSPYWIFDRLAIKEGLSNTYVSDIVKDSRGFIWIATTNGLNRYNTHEFEVFYADNENKNTISSDHVNCLLEDRSGRFWVGTDNGLNLYHPQSKTFTRYMPDSVDYENAKTQYISTLTEDCTGAIWVGTSRNGALRFNPETEVFDQPIPTVDTLNNSYYTSYVKCILIDTQQNVWIGTNGFGVLRYNPNTGDTKHWLHQQDGVTPNEMSYCFALYQDDEGEIWAGTFIGGLAKFIPETETFNLIPNPYNPNESIKNGVISINKNPDGGLILGTNGGGLFTFDPATLKFLKNYTFSSVNNHSVSDDFIGRIYIDNTGIIWLGTENGGLTYYDPNRRKFPLVEKKTIAGQELPLSIINTLYVDDNALIWIGTENSGFASYDPQKQTIKRFQMPHVQRKGGNTFVKCSEGDRHGGLWVGAQMGGLAHYTGEGVLIKQYSDELQPNDPFKLKDTDLNVICTGENEELWIGGLRGLTHKIGDRFINYCAAENIDNGNCSETVLALYNLNETHLLVGYQQDGLRIFNKKTKTFESHFTRENSDLSSDAIFCIREAKDGKIWIGTENGLNELSLVDSSIVSYTKVDGLPNAKIMAIEISESDEL